MTTTCSKNSLKVLVFLLILQSFIFIFKVQASADTTYIFNEDFTTGEGFAMDVPFNQTGYTPPTKFAYYVPSGTNLSSHKVTTLTSGETVLEIDGTQGGNNYNTYGIKKTGLSLSGKVVVEAKYRFTNSAGRKRFMAYGTGGGLTYFEGSYGANAAYQANGKNDDETGVTTRTLTAPTFPLENNGYSDWYQTKMVMYKNSNGRYIYDLFTKANPSVTDWHFERTMIPSNVETNLLTGITNLLMETFIMNGSTDKMQIDYWKAYESLL